VIEEALAKDQPLDNKRTFGADIKTKLFFAGCKCGYCGSAILNIDDCEVDHIVPHSKGGMTVIENAQLLHSYCNKQKRDTTNIETEILDDTEDE